MRCGLGPELNVDGVTESCLGRLEDRLAERGMCVDRGGDVVVGSLERDGESHLRNHLGGIRPDDVGSDDLAVRLVEEELHKSVRLSDCKGLAAGLEGELADLDLESLFLGDTLSESDARDLRLAVGATWEGPPAGGGALAEHSLNGLNGLPAGDMRKPRWPDNVSRRVDAGDAGLVAVVDGNISSFVELDRSRAAWKQWRDADRHEGDIGRKCFVSTAGDSDLHTVFRGLGFLDLRAGEDTNALLGKGLLERYRNLGVLDRKDVRHHLDDGHLRAESIEEVGKLDADRAGPDDDDLLRLLRDGKRMAAANDAGAVERKAGHLAGDNSRGDQDLRRGEFLLRAISAPDLDLAGFRNAGITLDVVDLVFLEEELDAAGELVGYLAGTADDLVPVVLEARNLEPEVCGMVTYQRIELRVFEQGFGRDAAPVQAGASGPFLLDDSDALAKLGGADSADIAGGAAADNDEVVGCRGHK